MNEFGEFLCTAEHFWDVDLTNFIAKVVLDEPRRSGRIRYVARIRAFSSESERNGSED